MKEKKINETVVLKGLTPIVPVDAEKLEESERAKKILEEKEADFIKKFQKFLKEKEV